MEQKKGKIIYNILISILMAYFIIRALVSFYGYTFHYEEKLFATLEMGLKLNEPNTVEQLKSILPEEYQVVDEQTDGNTITIKNLVSSFQDLELSQNMLTELLQKKLPDNSYEITNVEHVPPKVSKRILRLELTVYIPAILMAISWFVYLFRWIQAVQDTKNNPPQPIPVSQPVNSKRSKKKKKK